MYSTATGLAIYASTVEYRHRSKSFVHGDTILDTKTSQKSKTGALVPSTKEPPKALSAVEDTKTKSQRSLNHVFTVGCFQESFSSASRVYNMCMMSLDSLHVYCSFFQMHRAPLLGCYAHVCTILTPSTHEKETQTIPQNARPMHRSQP